MKKQLIFLAILLLTSCTQKNKEIPDHNTLTVALGASPATLDPRFATDANGMRIAGILFNSLVKLGPNLNLEGDAAESWSYKKNTYTFTLRPNLSFSNGQPVTAEDIRYTFQQYQSPKCPFHSAFKVIEKVEVDTVKEKMIVRVKLKQFSATFLASDLPVIKILPKGAVETQGEDFGRKPVGSGSFQFVSQSANEIRLQARTDHPFAKPKIKNLVFKVIKDDNTRFLKTYKGAIDIAQATIPSTKVHSFETNQSFQVYKYPGLSMSYILINLEDPTLKKPEVRRAIAHAINRQDIIKYKLEGLAEPATSILSPANPFFNKGLQVIPFNFTEAQKMLTEIKKLGVTLTLKTSNSQSAVENGKVLAQQISDAGLNIKLQSYEWGTFYGDIKKGNFQLATMRWVGAMDPDIYRISLHSKELPPGRNRGRYKNKTLDRLVEDGLKISNAEKRIKHYHKVQEIVMKDLPIIPLWYDTQVAIVNSRVQGYVPPKNGDFSSFARVSKSK